MLRFRGDLIDRDSIQELVDIRQKLKKKSPTLEDVERGHLLLARVGGSVFPRQAHVENVELFFTASVIALAIRTFFIQPFSIPTNSMWPTFSGMTAETTVAMDRNPLLNFAHGITPYDVISPASGNISIPINGGIDAMRQKSLLPYVEFRKWRFGILPTRFRRYELFVGGTAVEIEVPAEFNMERLLVRKFFPHVTSRRLSDILSVHSPEFRHGRRLLSTGKLAEKSKVLLSFDMVHGDVILVNRLTTHFIHPSRGDAVVFATRHVPSLRPMDRYYIKRLVARSGDVLTIDDMKLYANGDLANFSFPMLCNNGKAPPYEGYFPYGVFESQSAVPVEGGSVFVMGDNSADSYDSRFFGAIPRGAIVGKPLLHLYPFLPSRHGVGNHRFIRKKYFIHRIIHLWDHQVSDD